MFLDAQNPPTLNLGVSDLSGVLKLLDGVEKREEYKSKSEYLHTDKIPTKCTAFTVDHGSNKLSTEVRAGGEDVIDDENGYEDKRSSIRDGPVSGPTLLSSSLPRNNIISSYMNFPTGKDGEMVVTLKRSLSTAQARQGSSGSRLVTHGNGCVSSSASLKPIGQITSTTVEKVTNGREMSKLNTAISDEDELGSTPAIIDMSSLIVDPNSQLQQRKGDDSKADNNDDEDSIKEARMISSHPGIGSKVISSKMIFPAGKPGELVVTVKPCYNDNDGEQKKTCSKFNTTQLARDAGTPVCSAGFLTGQTAPPSSSEKHNRSGNNGCSSSGAKEPVRRIIRIKSSDLASSPMIKVRPSATVDNINASLNRGGSHPTSLPASTVKFPKYSRFRAEGEIQPPSRTQQYGRTALTET